MANNVEKPLLPSEPTAEPVQGATDLIENSTDLGVNPKASESVDSEAVAKAEELAAKEKRDAVPASEVGWKQIGEWEEKDALTADDELIDLAVPTLLDSYLPEIAYGDWYHTAGLIIISGLLSFFCGWFKFSLAPVFFIVLPSAIYYRTSIKKYRAGLRDEIQKEFTVSHIENDYETMDWLNTFLDKYWIFLEPSVSQIVTEQANPILASQEAIPAFIKAIWIDQFTVGIKPPRIDFVKTLDIPKDDVVVMDWEVSFTPHDTADASAKQLKNYVNQRTVVKATLFGITIPVLVENLSFKSWARVRVKMMKSFPHIQTVSVSLMEPPEFDFTTRLFGESVLNWEVLAIPGFYPLINEMVKKYVGPMLFQPFSFQLNIPQLLSGSNTSVGVLTITARSAKGLKAADRIIGNTIDPYLTFSYNGKDVLAKTKTIENTLAPVWNDTVSVLVGSFTEPLIITAFDYNDDRKDKNIGTVQLDLNDLLEKESGKSKIGQFLRNSKPVGELLYDYEYFPTLEGTRLPDGSVQPPPDLNTGLVKIELTELRNVATEGTAKLSCYAQIYLNNELVKTSPVIKNNNNPTFSIPYESIITDRRSAKVKVLIRDPKGKLIAGGVQTLNNLIDRSEIDEPWVPFTKGEGEFKISTVWKSVALKNVAGAGGYTEPIGVIRVLFNKAENLRNLDKIGKSDPYGRVLVNDIAKARTNFIDDDLDPEWNEAVYVPITSPNQKVTLEVMDWEKNGPDRTLGSFNVKIGDLIQKNDDDKYVEYVDQELRTGRLVHKKGPKGTLVYGLSFYPALPVKTLEDIQNEKDEKAKKAQALKEGQKVEANDDGEDDDFNETSKLDLSLPQLISYNTGVFVYSILEGEIGTTDTYLQVYFDAHGYPDYVSPLISSPVVKRPTVGDALIKELEWSTATFRLVKKKDANRNAEPIAESTIPTLSLLKNAYSQPQVLTLSGIGNNKIRLQTQWIPVEASSLPPADLITNTGNLDLDIIGANGLAAADSNGKSDPFVKCYLNKSDDNFFKTKTIKKTLDPVWNEKTSIEIGNRVNSFIRFKICDWDFGAGQDDTIGNAVFDLAQIDPVNPSQYDVKVIDKQGGDAGVLHIKTSFRPGYVVTLTSETSNIGDAGLKGVGTGIGAGIGAGKSVISGGVGVVGKVKKGIFGGLHHHKSEEAAKEED